MIAPLGYSSYIQNNEPVVPRHNCRHYVFSGAGFTVATGSTGATAGLGTSSPSHKPVTGHQLSFSAAYESDVRHHSLLVAWHLYSS